MKKNGPSSLMAVREGELTAIQTAFCADLILRISHAGMDCQHPGGTPTAANRTSKREAVQDT